MKLDDLQLYAWVGPDDQLDLNARTEEIGVKQGLTIAGQVAHRRRHRSPKIGKPAHRG